MKDIIKRSVVILLFGIFLAYLCYLLINGQQITTSEFWNLNIVSYILLIALCLFMITCYGIYPIHVRFSRSTLLVLSLALIILSQTIFTNSGPNGVFVGDFFSVLGVIILILFPTNILTTDKVKKKKSEKNIEIIEV